MHTWALTALLAAAACSGERGAPGSAAAGAEGCFPGSRPTVRWIVPTSAGGGQDVVSRLLEPFFERAIGAEIVIDNVVGAGGTRGARTIRDAEADGRTLGIINATGRLVAELSGDRSGLHPLNDFTVLGRITVEDPVWMVRPGSGLESVEELLARASDRPIVMGITDVGGAGFVFASVPAELLGIEVRYVPGYPGGRDYALGLMRGEFDVGGFSFESMRDRVEAGDLIPILQISDAPVSDHPALAEVPLFAGADQAARRRALADGGDIGALTDQAEALARLFEFGRMIVAPPGVSGEMRSCLAGRLGDVAADATFLEAAARAQRTIRFATSEELAADLRDWADAAERLSPILERHLETARRGASSR